MNQTTYDLSGCVAYSYSRFSDPSQGGGHSLERQQEYAPQFCQEYGCRLNTSLTFADLGKSAFHGKHVSAGGGLHRFLECIEAGLVQERDILIIENLDRMSRLPLDEAEDLLKSILSQGVRIHTRSPWAIYDRATLRDPMQRMQAIFEFTRSHRESVYKQERLSRRWSKNRAAARSGDYKLATVPGWIRAVKSGNKVQRFEIIKERATAVRRIFELCIDGHGLYTICKILNADKVPTFGKSEFWQRSTIAKILHNRSVVGEYQPFSSVRIDGPKIESTKRIPSGDPIPKYYPAVIDHRTFEQAQLALSKRADKRPGAGGLRVTNLFPGLIVDARDGSRMSVVDKGYGPRIVSTKEALTSLEATYVSYQLLEDAFAVYVDEMPLSLVMPKNTKELDRELNLLRKEVESLELQVAKIKAKTRTSTNDALLDLLVERDTELKQKRLDLEAMERQRGSSATVAAKTTKALLTAIRTATDEQLLTIRTKLRNELRYWLKKIVVLPMRLGNVRALMASAELTNGEWLELRATDALMDWPKELDGLTAKDFKTWPKNVRKTLWDVESAFDATLRQMHGQGATFADIAERLDSTISVVSKRALTLGLRKVSQRTKFTADRQMLWRSGCNGWVRSFNGKRHFIGCRKLKELYPRLVTSLDEAGTQKAATRWWCDNVG
jgi:DNA invertase Pin-like site-specific DNA recombinase